MKRAFGRFKGQFSDKEWAYIDTKYDEFQKYIGLELSKQRLDCNSDKLQDDSRDVMELLIESMWRHQGKKTYYVDSIELPDIMANSRCTGEVLDISTSNLINDPILFSFPLGATIDGYKIRSILSMRMKASEMGTSTKALMLGCILEEENGVRWSSCLVMDLSKGSEIRDINAATRKGLHKEIQHIAAQLGVIGMSVYCHTFPDMLIDGFPESMKDRQIKYGINLKEKSSYIKSNKNFTDFAITPHFRVSHFRCLRGLRFKHNADGSYRVVFVKGCMVGARNITPTTVLEPTT